MSDHTYRAFKITIARRGGTWSARWSCGWFEREAFQFGSEEGALWYARKTVDLHYECEAEQHWREFCGVGIVGNGMKG